MRLMAVDFGEARTGLAICDRAEVLASPLGVIEEKGLSKIIGKIVCAALAHEAAMVVVGLPRNMDGSEGERARRCRQVADMLREMLPGVPVELWDERGSTKQAAIYLNATDTRGQKRKKVIDAASAAIILESYLAYRRSRGQK